MPRRITKLTAAKRKQVRKCNFLTLFYVHTPTHTCTQHTHVHKQELSHTHARTHTFALHMTHSPLEKKKGHTERKKHRKIKECTHFSVSKHLVCSAPRALFRSQTSSSWLKALDAVPITHILTHPHRLLILYKKVSTSSRCNKSKFVDAKPYHCQCILTATNLCLPLQTCTFQRQLYYCSCKIRRKGQNQLCRDKTASCFTR